MVPTQPATQHDGAGEGGLVKAQGVDAFQRLLDERKKIQERIQKRRGVLESLKQSREALLDLLAQGTEPLRKEFLEVGDEVHRVFLEVLGKPKVRKRTRLEILTVQGFLLEEGILPPPSDPTLVEEVLSILKELDDSKNGHGASRDEDLEDFEFLGDGFSTKGPGAKGGRSSCGHGGRRPGFPGASSDDGPQVASAPQHGAGDHGGTLRSLFRRLALHMHPDRASDESDRLRRTEAIKEVTRAYEQGDLTRLMELEQSMFGAMGFVDDTDEQRAKRRAEAEAINKGLHAQLQKIEQDLSRMRLELRLQGLDSRRVVSERGRRGILEEALADGREQLSAIQGVHEFVLQYRDGRIKHREFMRGPQMGFGNPSDPTPEDEYFEFLENQVMEAIFGNDTGRQTPSKPNGSRKKRRS